MPLDVDVTLPPSGDGPFPTIVMLHGFGGNKANYATEQPEGSITAAYPRWLWSDLVNALLPNGRFLDFRVSSPTESREPIGVPIQSFISGLYAKGAGSGFYAPAGVDPGADLTGWFGRIQAGEPYGADTRAIADEIHAHHQGFGLSGTPAPLLLHGGWTDDLFPSSEPLRIYNALRAANPSARVSLQFADLGHQRGSNKVNGDRALNDAGSAFLDAYLRGAGAPPAPGSVTAFTQTCPQDAPAGGPFTAASWPELHPGAVTFGTAAAQTVTSGGGDPQTAQAFDPISGGGDACKSTASASEPGTAAYTGFRGGRYTLMGRPTVTADIQTTGANGQLVSRLWDVAPGGTQVLIARGVYRLTDDQRGRITFQLSGNGYRFAPGHAPRLQLLGRDAPAFRASNGSFSVSVSNVRAVLPVAERPGSVPGVGAPPAGLQALARKRPRLSVRVRLGKRRVLRTTGRLILPRGVSRARGCRGRVAIRVRARTRTIAKRRPAVRRKTCRFASKVRFRRPGRFGTAKRLTVRVRFGGNAALTPAKIGVRRVRIRR